MAEIVSGKHERLGDAVLAAQAAYAEAGIMPELLAIYYLFANPGLKLRQPRLGTPWSSWARSDASALQRAVWSGGWRRD